MNTIYAEPIPARAEAMVTTEKAPRAGCRDAFRATEILLKLCAVEDVRADPRDLRQAPTPRRCDIIGMVPQHVIGDARHSIGGGQSSNALGLAPCVRRIIDRRELAVANEGELRRLLDGRAPARRI